MGYSLYFLAAVIAIASDTSFFSFSLFFFFLWLVQLEPHGCPHSRYYPIIMHGYTEQLVGLFLFYRPSFVFRSASAIPYDASLYLYPSIFTALKTPKFFTDSCQRRVGVWKSKKIRVTLYKYNKPRSLLYPPPPVFRCFPSHRSSALVSFSGFAHNI